MGSVKRAGDLLSSLFNDEFDPRSLKNGRALAGLYSSWTGIAAETKIPAASDHTRIRELEHGILVIEAEHPGWVQLLQTKQAQLLKILQKRFPELEIHGLSFCLSREAISRPSGPQDSEIMQSQAINSVSSDPFPEPASYEKNEALYESIKEFKKIIQKKNKNPPEASLPT